MFGPINKHQLDDRPTLLTLHLVWDMLCKSSSLVDVRQDLYKTGVCWQDPNEMPSYTAGTYSGQVKPTSFSSVPLPPCHSGGTHEAVP